MNFSVFLQISDSICIQASVWSPHSVFIKITCVVGGYGVWPSAVDGTGHAVVWYKFQEAEIKGSWWCPYSQCHSSCTPFSHSQSRISPTLLATGLPGRLELPSTHILASPCPPSVLHPSSLQSHDKMNPLFPMINPPTTQLLYFLLSVAKRWWSWNHQSFSNISTGSLPSAANIHWLLPFWFWDRKDPS